MTVNSETKIKNESSIELFILGIFNIQLFTSYFFLLYFFLYPSRYHAFSISYTFFPFKTLLLNSLIFSLIVVV